MILSLINGSVIMNTCLSAQNLVGWLFYAAIIPIIGWIVDVYTLVQALFVLGVTSLIAGIIILSQARFFTSKSS